LVLSNKFRAIETGSLPYRTLVNAIRFSEINQLPCLSILKKLDHLYRTCPIYKVPETLLPKKWYIEQLIYWQRHYHKNRLGNGGITALELKLYYDFVRLIKILSIEGSAFFFDYEMTDHSKKRVKMLKIIEPFPANLLKPILHFQKVVLMSGTLFPIKKYATLFNLPAQFQVFISPHLPKNNLFLMFNRNRLSSKQSDRKSVSFEVQAQIITVLHNFNPKHTIVFSPSEEYTKLLTKITKRKFPDQNFLVQGLTSQANQLLLQTLKSQTHALVFANIRGSFAEGIEILDEKTKSSKISMIIFTGFPASPPNQYQQVLEHHYQKKFGYKGKILFLRWMSVYQLLLQATGRGVRRPNDYCVIISLDYRIAQMKIFPKELTVNTANFQVIKTRLKEFFENQ
jgi:Rad3-related DNA helicase